MTAKECITGRRSIRQYTDQPVSHELLAQIVETASYAPSWKHTQIVRYIAVEGEKKAKLAACTSSFPGNGKIMENAPMVVAVTVIKGRSTVSAFLMTCLTSLQTPTVKLVLYIKLGKMEM